MPPPYVSTSRSVIRQNICKKQQNPINHQSCWSLPRSSWISPAPSEFTGSQDPLSITNKHRQGTVEGSVDHANCSDSRVFNSSWAVPLQLLPSSRVESQGQGHAARTLLQLHAHYDPGTGEVSLAVPFAALKGRGRTSCC